MSPNDMLALASEDLACYSTAQWCRLELASYHKRIIEMLEAIEKEKARRGMVFLPPRHSKTLLCNLLFSAYFLGRHPDRSIITTSYGQDLADDFGLKVRSLVSNPIHKRIFPGFRLSGDATSIRRFTTTAGGSYYAIGRGGPITGRGADLLLIDDPIKDHEEARSEAVRHSLQEWYASVAYPRLQPGAAVILIQTRWHKDDLAGWLLREHASENWTVICLPAIAEKDESFRRAGEALWPEHYPLESLARIRAAIGGPAWTSLYQQQPSAAEGRMFKRDWWRFDLEPPVCKRIVHSWDTAYKTGAQNDYSACTVWGVKDNAYHLLWFWQGREEFPELKKQMHRLADQWKPTEILVEDRASGQCLIQELKRNSVLPIIAAKVDKDKESRAQAITPLIEGGKVFLPESAPWLDYFIDQFAAFPMGTHDDAVDSTTLALNYLRNQQINSVACYVLRL